VTEPRHDIDDRADCERLVRAFYSRALEDPVIGWLFVDVAKLDLEAHVPVIASFWETILLGAGTYRGGAFRPHAALHMKARLRGAHFARWLVLWRARSSRRRTRSAWRRRSTRGCRPSPPRVTTRRRGWS
jgi:hemoglobin